MRTTTPIESMPPLEPLLWAWPDVLQATNVPRRTLERELSAGRFPKPIKRVGKRPYWDPSAIRAWASGVSSSPTPTDSITLKMRTG
jgi:predicted DNA-binding transcriptional regulator AlpA